MRRPGEKTEAPEHVRQMHARAAPPDEQLEQRGGRASGAPPESGVPLTPADPRFREYWLTRTTAEAHAAGVTQIVTCRDAVYVPLDIAPY